MKEEEEGNGREGGRGGGVKASGGFDLAGCGECCVLAAAVRGVRLGQHVVAERAGAPAKHEEPPVLLSS